MAAVLLSVHVVVAVVFVGAVTIAVSLFPRYARQALEGRDPAAVPALRLLHRVTRVYAVLSLAVPVFGIATASSLGVLTDAWVLASMALTLLAAGVLVGVVLPGQQEVLAAAAGEGTDGGEGGPGVGTVAGTLTGSTTRVRRLAMASGTFNLVWVVVVVLMVVRPGSTTGV
ncbi:MULTISPECIES: hypothetical protein [unclassified Geodermatophilus]